MDLLDWEAEGDFLILGDRQVFFVDTGGPGVPLLILHGYPTSSFDYRAALPALSASRRVVVHDQLGFGLTDKPRRHHYSLIEQTELALALWDRLGIRSGHVVAHDYGTSVATELLARRSEAALDVDIGAMTLCNGSMHIEMARVRPIQRMLATPVLGSIVAALSTRAVFAYNLRRLVVDPASLPDADIDVMWELLVRDGGRRALPPLTRYLQERRHNWDRWIGALRRTDVPIHVVWGTEDPVAVVEMAHTLVNEIPDSTVTFLEDVGHFPMLEAPHRWVEAVLASGPAPAGPAALPR